MRATDKEVTEALKEQVYWRSVCVILGCKLIGWSYYDSATVQFGSREDEIQGWMARKILELSERLEREGK